MTASNLNDLVKSVRNKDFRPIYLLMGNESYYIDKMCELFENSILTDEEKDMNLTILYGRDIKADNIINEARRYPVMAKYNLVIVKELQGMEDDVDKLSNYVRHAPSTTILVLCYKNGNIDRRKKIVDEISKNGYVYVSDKLKETALPEFIHSYAKRHRINISDDATLLLAEFVGNDLSKLTNEIDKLSILTNGKPINRTDVIANIGMSKEYNVFELKDALLNKDIRKSNLIANYMEDNSKNYPMPAVLPILFSYFSNLMLAYYSPQKDPRSLCSFLNLKSEWQTKDYQKGMANFTGKKVMNIIDKIKDADARSKGASGSQEHILKDLVYFILH